MFKTSEEIVVIQAEATTPIPTGVVFWSHDKGTAKLIIQLKKDHINQTLPQGTIVPILLEFNSDTAANGRGRHIYHAVIEDALEGIVSIVLEDNILGYVGRVDGSVYIELPDSRSLDTAGRFTFDIKRSPIDDDVPELEDYYWQGFNEIIQESKRLINQVESDCKIVLDNLNSKVTVLETQTTDIKYKQAEILKTIEEHDVFTKQESSVNVIYQVIGKEKVRLTFTLDLNSASSIAFAAGYSSLLPITNTAWRQLTDEQLQTVLALDGSIFVSRDLANNYRKQVRIQWNVLPFIKAELGEDYFIDKGITEDTEILNHLKEVIIEDEANVWGFGVGGLVNKLNMSVLNKQNQWFDPVFNTDATVSKLTRSGDFKSFVSDTGALEYIVYSEPTANNSYSTVNLDYMNYKFSIDVSMNEHIKALIATNHVENLATEDEAESGEDNSKIMTPLRVFQAIAKWTKDKFVSKTENETILGVKNFETGLQVNGKNVLSQDGVKRLYINSTTNSSWNAGSATFIRYGDIVTVFLNFQVRSSGDLGKDANVVAESIVDDIYQPHENFYFFIGTESNQAVVKFVGKGIKANSVLASSQWYIGTATYLAKNKL